MTLTDALLHPWLSLGPQPVSNTTPAAAASPTTSQPKPPPLPPLSNPAAAQPGLDRKLSDLSELSELPEDAEIDEVAEDEVQRDVSMLSAAPSVDMPGVQALNIGSPARARVRAPLERRSQVLARELAAEADDAAVSPSATVNANANGGGGKRPRDAVGSQDADVAMGDHSPDSDGAGAAQMARAAKRGRRNVDEQDGAAVPPPQGNNGAGRALRSRNAGAAAAGAAGVTPR